MRSCVMAPLRRYELVGVWVELDGAVLNEPCMLKKDLVIRARGRTCFGGTSRV